MNKKENICFVAGKSGGHLIPALTIAQKIIQKSLQEKKELKALFFTTNNLLDKKIIKEATIYITQVQLPLGKIRYSTIIKHPMLAFNLIHSFAKSFFYLVKYRPKKIISMGGLVSLPVCMAGFILRIPIELFELNTTPGKAVTFLAPLAKKIHICFSKAMNYLPKKKCTFSQYPVRFAARFPVNTQKHNLEAFGFSKSKFTLLILGGSQGSLAINNLIKEMVNKTPDIHEHMQIIHQTGRQDTTNWQEFYKKRNIAAIAFDFKKDIHQHYHIADIVVCRSGAGTLFETMFFKKKCITIPLEAKTSDHQVDNAKEIEKMHPKLVTLIKQDKNCSHLFIKEIGKQIQRKLRIKQKNNPSI